MGAVYELLLVFIVLGIPMAIAWRRTRKAELQRVMGPTFVQWDAFHRTMQESVAKGHADELARQRQKIKDDKIFKTVEEYRNATD